MTPEHKEQIRERCERWKSYAHELRRMADQILTPSSRSKKFFNDCADTITDIPALLAANDELELLVKGLEGNLKACEEYLDRTETQRDGLEKRVKELEDENKTAQNFLSLATEEYRRIKTALEKENAELLKLR